jgi:uncharacterized membrane protein HdeD (DUF308 family)
MMMFVGLIQPILGLILLAVAFNFPADQRGKWFVMLAGIIALVPFAFGLAGLGLAFANMPQENLLPRLFQYFIAYAPCVMGGLLLAAYATKPAETTGKSQILVCGALMFLPLFIGSQATPENSGTNQITTAS